MIFFLFTSLSLGYLIPVCAQESFLRTHPIYKQVLPPREAKPLTELAADAIAGNKIPGLAHSDANPEAFPDVRESIVAARERTVTAQHRVLQYMLLCGPMDLATVTSFHEKAVNRRFDFDALKDAMQKTKWNPALPQEPSNLMYPLLYAVSENRMGGVKALVAAKASLSQYYASTTPLLVAVKREFTDMVQLLLALGANVNEHAEGEFPLGDAGGNSKIVQILVTAKADINFKTNQHSFSALECSVGMERVEILNILLDHNVTVNPLCCHPEKLLQMQFRGLPNLVEIDVWRIVKAQKIATLLQCHKDAQIKMFEDWKKPRTQLSQEKKGSALCVVQ